MKFQPHPPWQTILKAMLSPSRKLRASQIPGYTEHITSRTGYSFRVIKALKPDATWYFPEYICVDPILTLRKHGAEVSYYPLKEDLTPDFEKIHPKPDSIFVFVQYFGRETELTLARSFCDQHKLTLVEDGAHLLRKKQKFESDFTVFSPYKTYGLPDGGLLVARKRYPINSFLVASIDKYGGEKWALKRLLEDLIPDRLSAQRKKSLMPSDPFLNLAVTPPPDTYGTHLGFNLMNQDLGDTEAIARRRNFQILSEHIDRLPAWMPRDLDAPYWFPVEFKNRSESLMFYKKWNQKDWVLQSWPDLQKDSSQNAQRLKETVLFLPVHSGVKAQKILKMIQ